MKKLVVILFVLLIGCELNDEVKPTTYQIKNTTNSDNTARPFDLYAVKVHFYKNDSIVKTDSIGDIYPGETSRKITAKNFHKLRPSFQFIKGDYTRYYTSRYFVLRDGENRIIKLTLRGFVLE